MEALKPSVYNDSVRSPMIKSSKALEIEEYPWPINLPQTTPIETPLGRTSFGIKFRYYLNDIFDWMNGLEPVAKRDLTSFITYYLS